MNGSSDRAASPVDMHTCKTEVNLLLKIMIYSAPAPAVFCSLLFFRRKHFSTKKWITLWCFKGMLV